MASKLLVLLPLKRTTLADVDGVIDVLKDHVGKDWKKVARELKFTQTDIDAIEYRERNDLKEQIHLFFEEWKMREGAGATAQKLVDAIKAARLQGILDNIRSALPDSEINTMPVQESSQENERELIRRKRLERLVSGGSDNPDSPTSEPSKKAVLRSVGTPPNSSVVSEVMKPSDSPPVQGIMRSSSSPRMQQFEVGDVVKIERKGKPWYGVIRWIGNLPNVEGSSAGIEMEEKVEGGHSGKWLGSRYFTCEDGYGLFLRTSLLKPDDRFDPPPLIEGPTPKGEDAEKDKQPSSYSPLLKSAVTSPMLKTALSLASPNSPEEEPGFASINDGATASSDEMQSFECPGDVAGFIIGKDGKNLRDVESQTNTKIVVHKNEHDKTANTNVLILGKKENREKALILIAQNVHRKIALHTATTDTVMIPGHLCGKVIGRGGANVQAIQNLTGARIQIERKEGLDAILDRDGPRKCEIKGSPEQIEKAKELIDMAQKGVDIAETAFIAAFVVKFLQELKKEDST